MIVLNFLKRMRIKKKLLQTNNDIKFGDNFFLNNYFLHFSFQIKYFSLLKNLNLTPILYQTLR